MRISFNPLAERELNDAAQYYDLESPGLGEALLAEVERSCHAIAEYPEAGPVVLGRSVVDFCAVFRTCCSTVSTLTRCEFSP